MDLEAEDPGEWFPTKPFWRENLTEEERKIGIAEAKGVLQFVALTRTECIVNNVTLNKASKMVLDAAAFIARNNMVEAVRLCFRIIELARHDHCTLKLDLSCDNIHIKVENSCVFIAVVELAISKAIPSIREDPEGKIVLRHIFHKLVTTQWTPTNYLMYKLQTIYTLLSNVSCPLDRQALTNNLQMAMRFKTFNSRILSYCTKLIEIVVMCTNSAEKRKMLELFQSIATWDTSDCYFVIYLLKHWPDQLLPKLNIILDRICTLTKCNAGPIAMRLLKVTLPFLDVYMWTMEFIPNVMELMPFDDSECRSFIQSTLLGFTSLAVKRFGRSVMDVCLDREITLEYGTIALLCCVQQDYVDVVEFKVLVQHWIENPSKSMQSFAIKAVCHVNNKTYKIEEWHLSMVQLYFDGLMLADVNFDDEVFGSFLSHICVYSNCIIREESSDAELNCKLLVYDKFIQWLYLFCNENLRSRDQRRVSIAAITFDLVCGIITESSASLKTKYSLNSDDEYEHGESPFFNHLKSVNSWTFDDNIGAELVQYFISSGKVFPEIGNLFKKWCNSNLFTTERDMFFTLGITNMSQLGKEFIEKGRYLIDIVLHLHEQGSAEYKKIIKKLYDDWHNSVKQLIVTEPDTENNSVVLIYCLNDLLKKGHIEMSDNTQLSSRIFNECIIAIRILLFRYKKNVGLLYGEITIKKKSTEQLISCCLDTISFIVKKSPSEQFLHSALDIANTVVLANSGRSTIATAAETIRHICGEILTPNFTGTGDNGQQQVIIITFLDSVLYSIHTASEEQTSNIRRSPEHRLVVHSIVSADRLPNHPYLVRTMNFLLSVFSNPSSSSSAVAATLHTMEALVIDNTIRYSTFPFISRIAIHCINEFASSDWKIKNAAIQVLQGLVFRILGQTCNLVNRRRATIEEIFVLYPTLAMYFYSKLQDFQAQESHCSIIAIMALFSESHSKLSIFLSDDMNFIISCFGKIFVKLVCTETSIAGIFAANAYSAIYPHPYIPSVISDIVCWLELGFQYMSKNTFYSVWCLLQSLYEKFNLSPKVFYYKQGLCKIHSVFGNLLLFLEQFNYEYEFSLFTLLSIKSNKIAKSQDIIFNQLQKSSYESRLWLHNNIPYVLRNINIHLFPNFLLKCFRQPIPVSLLKHFLNGILTRHDELIENSLASHVLDILMVKFFEVQDMCTYIVCSFSLTILLLLENCTFTYAKDFITKAKSSYNTPNISIYTLAVYIALLSHDTDYSDEDQVFINRALAIFKNTALIEDPELQFYIASTLKYLYKCVEVPDRHHLFKIAFILLLNRNTGLEICKFVSYSFQVELCSVYTTLNTLINIKNLSNQLGTITRAAALLVDLTIFTSSLSDAFEDCGEFYMKQNSDICSHKSSVKKMLLEQVKAAFTLMPRQDCIRILNCIS